MKKYERHAQSQRKHGPLPVSSASKAPAPPPVSRPGWTGPGYVKKAARQPRAPSAPTALASTVQDHVLSIELQQRTLDIIRDTFPASHDFETLKPLLHQVNDALLQKDFETAFGKQEFMEGYAIRWSPSRALGYSNLLAQICEQRKDDAWVRQLIGDDRSTPAKALCFGGGAAEIMAFAALLRHFREGAAGKPAAASSIELDDMSNTPLDPTACTPPVNIHLVDAADWSLVASKLQAGLKTPPTLSKYASAVARASNASFLSTEAVEINFTRTHVFTLSLEDLRPMIGPDQAFITLLFTLNDLYTTSIPKTTAFLRRLTSVTPAGSMLLVVDSPEATSTAGIAKDGEEKKEYPMSWLLNKTLLPTREKGQGDEKESEPAWEKLMDDANRVYKKPEKGLWYPVSLENLRLQVQLFKRL
ncbi:uncharacterized protein JN550_007889 [Neoarthrinium moseri]|uniref:uncharacterized protein n=1 Tax=Neoarthrinium moseri TaxID=1658444 RepID=UPI001FDB70F4|nr:uncharacterized protein JN550_007889 [Neoarthrinium moseri]KAI1866200.1 hypothetical protein JN550_007889 [Neoarthrinium moseri]